MCRFCSEAIRRSLASERIVRREQLGEKKSRPIVSNGMLASDKVDSPSLACVFQNFGFTPSFSTRFSDSLLHSARRVSFSVAASKD